MPNLATLVHKTFENIVGKEGNVGNQHFLLFPHCLLAFPKQITEKLKMQEWVKLGEIRIKMNMNLN